MKTPDLLTAVDSATAAFFKEIAAHFPTIETGDLDPAAAQAFHEAAVQAAKAWVLANQPEG